MDAERHGVVHFVVLGGDVVEHLVDFVLLLGKGDLLEAEAGFLVFVAESAEKEETA